MKMTASRRLPSPKPLRMGARILHLLGQGDQDGNGGHHIVGDKGYGGKQPVAQQGVAAGEGEGGKPFRGQPEDGKGAHHNGGAHQQGHHHAKGGHQSGRAGHGYQQHEKRHGRVAQQGGDTEQLLQQGA